MPVRTPFLLRTDPSVLAALRRWADDELRSLNGQIDYVLRQALRESGRLPQRSQTGTDGDTGPNRDERKQEGT